MFYELVVGIWEYPPSEFWQMTAREIQVLIEAKRPKQVGGIHEDELERLHKKRQELIESGVKVL